MLHRVTHADRTGIKKKKKMNFQIANRDSVKKQADPMYDSQNLQNDNDDTVIMRYNRLRLYDY